MHSILCSNFSEVVHLVLTNQAISHQDPECTDLSAVKYEALLNQHSIGQHLCAHLHFEYEIDTEAPRRIRLVVGKDLFLHDLSIASNCHVSELKSQHEFYCSKGEQL
jgi:hypothetical protein